MKVQPKSQIDLATYVFDFGKHKGKTFEYVWKNDYSYVRWCVDVSGPLKGRLPCHPDGSLRSSVIAKTLREARRNPVPRVHVSSPTIQAGKTSSALEQAAALLEGAGISVEAFDKAAKNIAAANKFLNKNLPSAARNNVPKNPHLKRPLDDTSWIKF